MAPKRSRSPKADQRSAALADHDASPEPSPASTAAAAAADADLHANVVHMKERITAPFMIYDTAARRIVPNPSYDRTVLAEVRRLQSIPLTRLRPALQANASYTPKELLYELESTLFCLCASATVAADTDALHYCTCDAEADALMPQLESFLAHHNAPAKTTVAVAYCLTEGTSHDILNAFISMLEQRINQELNPDIDRRRSEAEHKALRSTKNNVQDMAQLLRDMATAYHCIDTPSQVQRRQPQSDATRIDVARSPAANAVPAQMIHEAFYKVLRWVMAVDTDRRALKVAANGATTTTGGGSAKRIDAATSADAAVAAAVAAVVSAGGDGEATSSAPAAIAAASTAGFATVVDYDPFTGQVTLERTSASQRWGLLLNPKGMLVGLENDLRNSSAAGERLYDAVQQQSGGQGGLAIYEVNRRRLRPVHLSAEALEDSEKNAALLGKLRDALTQPTTKTLHLSLERRRQADLTAPQEVLYEVSYQGGEGGVGQRVLLMLERASPSIPWGMKLKYLKGAPAVLADFATNVRLSAAAKDFLFDMRGRVRVLTMNNKPLAALSAAEMKALVSGALVLTMQLQVTDANGDVPVVLDGEAEAVGEAQEKQPWRQQQQQPEPTEEDAPAAAQEVEEAGEAEELDEAEVTADATVPSIEQPDLDDIAASIADDFLLQQDRATAAFATAAAADALEDGEPQAKGDGGDAFEEFDWANPSAKRVAADDGDDGAEPLDEDPLEAQLEETADGDAPTLEANPEDAAAEPTGAVEDDHEAARTLLKEFNLLPSEPEPTASLEEKPAKGEGGRAAKAATAAGKKKKKLKGKKGKKAPTTSRSRKNKVAAAEAEEDPEGDGEDAAAAEEKEAAVEDAGEDTPAATEIEKSAAAEELAEAAPAAVEGAEAEAEAAPEKASKSRKGKQATSAKKKKGGKKAAEKSKGKKGSRAVKSAEAAETAPDADEAEAENPESSHPESDAAAGAPAGATTTTTTITDEAAHPLQTGAVDVPLVALPPTSAELAMAAGAKNAKEKGKGKGKAEKATASSAKKRAADKPKRKKKGEAEEAEAKEDKTTGADEEEKAADTAPAALKDDSPAAAVDSGAPRRVSIAELVQAAPLTFENDVQMKRFDGAQLELERSSVASPWNIKVAFAGDDIIMTKLPPIPKAEARHPFLRSLGAGAQGEVKWVVEGLNGQDLSSMSKALKAKALDAIKGSTKLTFALKALRK